MAPTKHELGVLYLVGAGLSIVGGMVGFLWITLDSLVLIGLGATLATSPFLAVGYATALWWRDGLSEGHAWNVAQWFALGLGLATVGSLGIAFVKQSIVQANLLPGFVVMLIGGGSAIGALVGLVVAFREDHHTMRHLYQRNTVMNRVLRHNIRNDMNVILAHTDMLAESVESSRHTDVIRRKTNDVIDLSRAARDVETLHAQADPQTTDVVDLIETYLEGARQAYPEAEFELEAPESAPATVDPLFRTVLDNLVDNAVTHNDADPEVEIAVAESDDGDAVEIRIADNGPGIPDSQFEVLDREAERADLHGSGLGLWLVKWFVDRHGGDLRFDTGESGGTTVCLLLPAA